LRRSHLLLPLAALAGAAACADPTAPPAGPTRPSTFAGDAAAPVRVEVKFREAYGVRLAEGALRASDGTRPDGAARAIARHGGADLRGRFAELVPAADALDRAARAGTGPVPDLASWYLVDAPDSARADALAADLRAAPEVEEAYVAPAPQEPPGRADARAAFAALVSPSFSALQGYFAWTVEGTGAEILRTLPGGDGRGIQVVDLEYAWYHAHEDLGMSAATHHWWGNPYLAFGDDHGTAVLGVLGGLDNGFGVTGGVPAATIRTVSPFPSQFYDPAAAIVAAAARLRRGDVLLLEQQAAGPTGGTAYVPLEWIPSVYDAVRAATSAGIVVVEAAGNGAVDLDGPALGGRFDPAVRHSGALIVGAGSAARTRLWFSSYGARLDVQGWGQGVATTGYGGLYGTSKGNWYTGTFGGTSSASAIVAATVAGLQGYVQAVTGGRSTPRPWRRCSARPGVRRPGTLGSGSARPRTCTPPSGTSPGSRAPSACCPTLAAAPAPRAPVSRRAASCRAASCRRRPPRRASAAVRATRPGATARPTAPGPRARGRERGRRGQGPCTCAPRAHAPGRLPGGGARAAPGGPGRPHGDSTTISRAGGQMTAGQRLAQIFGWAFIVMGLAGFAATGGSMVADHTVAPRLFGLFPVNALHNVVHLVFGVWGVLGARSVGGARSYLVGAGLVYLILAALGYIVPNGLGLVPLGGNDIGLHLFLGLGLLLSGLLTSGRGREAADTRAG
jgi:hypothetical protein